MHYDIRNATALGVVKGAATEAAGYDTDLKNLTAALGAAEAALAHSDVVVGAIGEYIKGEAAKQLEGILGHTGSAVAHTSEAIALYAEGSDAMAARAARASASATVPASMPGTGGGPR